MGVRGGGGQFQLIILTFTSTTALRGGTTPQALPPQFWIKLSVTVCP